MGALDRSLLLGSDLLDENLALARAGADEIPTRVRARVRWERRDLVADGPPAGRWRLVLCRNVAIYLAAGGARSALYATLVVRARRRGVLLLGRSERLIDPAALGLRPVGPTRTSGCDEARLTGRTLAVSLLIVARRRGRAGALTVAIDRQHDARRARAPLAGRDRRREPRPSSACWASRRRPRLS